jgi:phage gpG-like protein
MARRSVVVVVDAKWDGDDAQDRLNNMKDRAANMRPVLTWAGKYLERAYSKNFTTMGSLSAKAMLKGAWPPLDSEYASWKATKVPGATPLIFSGKLFRSVSSMNSNSKNTLSDMEATFAIDSPIAKFHQYGTQDMPSRKILFVPRDFDRDINKKASQYIVNGSKMT